MKTGFEFTRLSRLSLFVLIAFIIGCLVLESTILIKAEKS